MNHLDYYRFQAKARGMHTLEDVRRWTQDLAHFYERIVRRWLPLDKNQPIGELACGHGSFLYWLKTCGYANLRAVDFNPEQLQLARQVIDTVEEADVNTWLGRQPANHYAALVGIDLVEHLPKNDLMELLRGAWAALSPGGSLILRLPNGDSPLVGMNLFNDITHVWTYTPNCLSSLAQMHGFARTEFMDEGFSAIRDRRWFKLPVGWISSLILRALFQAATREEMAYLSPNLWARLVK